MHIMWMLSEQGSYGDRACCSSRVVGNIRSSKRICLHLFLLVGVLIRVLSSSYWVSRYELLEQSCFAFYKVYLLKSPNQERSLGLSKHADLATAQHRLQFERIINIPFSWLGLWLHSACTRKPCKSFLSACWWCNTSSAVEIGGSGYETTSALGAPKKRLLE